jgi:hypothetical protein
MRSGQQKTGRRLALEEGAAVLVAFGLDLLGELTHHSPLDPGR